MFWKSAGARQQDEPFFAAYRDADPNGPVTVSIDPERIESPAHGGLMLADFARHMARAMAQAGKSENETAALGTIVELFRAEMENPTDAIEGSIRH